MYSLRHIHPWTLFQFIVVLLKPIILFLLTIIAHPSSTSENLDLKFNYFLQRRWFFGLLIALIIVNILIDIITSVPILLPHVILFSILAFAIVISGLIFKNEKYHRFLAYIAAVTLGFYIVHYFWVLQQDTKISAPNAAYSVKVQYIQMFLSMKMMIFHFFSSLVLNQKKLTENSLLLYPVNGRNSAWAYTPHLTYAILSIK